MKSFYLEKPDLFLETIVMKIERNGRLDNECSVKESLRITLLHFFSDLSSHVV